MSETESQEIYENQYGTLDALAEIKDADLPRLISKPFIKGLIQHFDQLLIYAEANFDAILGPDPNHQFKFSFEDPTSQAGLNWEFKNTTTKNQSNQEFWAIYVGGIIVGLDSFGSKIKDTPLEPENVHEVAVITYSLLIIQVLLAAKLPLFSKLPNAINDTGAFTLFEVKKTFQLYIKILCESYKVSLCRSLPDATITGKHSKKKYVRGNKYLR